MPPATSVVRELLNSRIQEFEADQIDLLLAADSCYDSHGESSCYGREMGETLLTKYSPSVHRAPPPSPEFLRRAHRMSHDTRLDQFDKSMLQVLTILKADYGGSCHDKRQI